MSDDTTSTQFGRLKRLKPSGTIGAVSPYVWFGGLFTLAVGGFALGVQRGYVDPQITLRFSANLGWAVEAFVGLLFVVFALLNLVMLARLAGVGFLNSVLNILVNAMDGFSKDSLNSDDE